MKEKTEKIPWDKFKENINISEDMLASEIKGIEKELKEAKERYDDDSYMDSEEVSNITENLFNEDLSEN